jgi:CBS domain-containing protein
MANELDDVKVSAIMEPKPQTVSPVTPLSKVSDKMLRMKVHSVIVVDDGKPVGMISSLDIVKTTFISEKAKDMPVSKLIEGQKLFFVYDEVNLRDALNLMVVRIYAVCRS